MKHRFVRDSSGEKASYTNWITGEPNNTSGNENCVELRTTSAYDGTWNDQSCDDMLAFVCQKH